MTAWRLGRREFRFVEGGKILQFMIVFVFGGA